MKRINTNKRIPVQLTESTLKHVCGGGIATSPGVQQLSQDGSDAMGITVNKAKTQDRMFTTFAHDY